MRVNLLYSDYEISQDHSYPYKSDIIKDLNLDRMFKSMAKEDGYIYSVVNSVIMIPLPNKEQILYRQEMLKDVLNNPIYFEQLYPLLTRTCTEIGKYHDEELRLKKSGATITKAGAIFRSLEFLRILVDNLYKLKVHIDNTGTSYSSTAMKKFCNDFLKEYSSEFVTQISTSVGDMEFLKEGGKLQISAILGLGMHSTDFIIQDVREGGFKNVKKSLKDSITTWYTRRFQKSTILLDKNELIHDARELEEAALSHILKMYQGFLQELSSFFSKLRYQIAFYMGCFHLHSRLTNLSIPLCFPAVKDPSEKQIVYTGLYELSLALLNRETPVSNDIKKEDTKMFIISGANQGGKSTFLRSFATAQLLMLCGMFVPALSYSCSICGNIFTHFTRREDSAMNSGRLDEELKRMQAIIKEVKPNDMVFLNESFASTTEKEGSQIAIDIANIFYEFDIKLFMVTHLFEFTKTMYEKNLEHAVFLSAERKEDGQRTYKMLEMPPSQTSFGMDLYYEIMG